VPSGKQRARRPTPTGQAGRGITGYVAPTRRTSTGRRLGGGSPRRRSIPSTVCGSAGAWTRVRARISATPTNLVGPKHLPHRGQDWSAGSGSRRRGGSPRCADPQACLKLQGAPGGGTAPGRGKQRAKGWLRPFFSGEGAAGRARGHPTGSQPGGGGGGGWAPRAQNDPGYGETVKIWLGAGAKDTGALPSGTTIPARFHAGPSSPRVEMGPGALIDPARRPAGQSGFVTGLRRQRAPVNELHDRREASARAPRRNGPIRPTARPPRWNWAARLLDRRRRDCRLLGQVHKQGWTFASRWPTEAPGRPSGSPRCCATFDDDLLTGVTAIGAPAVLAYFGTSARRTGDSLASWAGGGLAQLRGALLCGATAPASTEP